MLSNLKNQLLISGVAALTLLLFRPLYALLEKLLPAPQS